MFGICLCRSGSPRRTKRGNHLFSESIGFGILVPLADWHLGSGLECVHPPLWAKHVGPSSNWRAGSWLDF